MKDGLTDIVGKQISAVLVARNNKRNPRAQVFLVFSDGSSFEFYGESFTCAGGLDPSGRIERAINPRGGQIVRIYNHARRDRSCNPMSTISLPPPYNIPAWITDKNAPESWQTASAAISKVKRLKE